MKKNIIIITTILLMGTIFPLAFLTIPPKNQNSNTIPSISIVPPTKNSNGIPANYSDNIDMDGIYVYNVTADVNKPGEHTSWINYDIDPYNTWKNWTTGEGGQVMINFTGFYDRHPNDPYASYALFPDTNMPYMDINITKPDQSLNISHCNCSNSEIFNNLAVGQSPFDSGMLIPINNLAYVKQLASEAAEDPYGPDSYSIDESYYFIQFNFENLYQTTELVYSKINGLLISINVKIQIFSDYHLEMVLTNFTEDFEEFNEQYNYTVNEYCNGNQYATIWEDFNYKHVDIWTSNEGGKIRVNFTGRYDKDSSDMNPDVFDATLKRPWMDIEIYYLAWDGLRLIMGLNNVSNREAANNLILGFNDWVNFKGFQPGFLIPSIDNITDIKDKANEAVASGDSLTIEETDLTIRFNYVQTGGGQTTDLIYEKRTGLLLRAETGFGNYHLTTTIEGFEYEEEPSDEGIPLLLLIIIYMYYFGLL